MALSMKKFNCDSFQMTIEFDEAQFKKKEFVLDVKPKTNKQNAFIYYYGSKLKSRKEHAHLFIGLDGKDSILRLNYHQSPAEVEDTRKPYLEDMANWISGFFEEKTLKAGVVAVFEYTKQYESLVQIGYPLLIGSSLYKDAKIIGHDIDLPDNSLVDRASIMADDKLLRIFLFGLNDIDLYGFNLHLEIEKFSKFANALVKKEGEDERSSRKS